MGHTVHPFPSPPWWHPWWPTTASRVWGRSSWQTRACRRWYGTRRSHSSAATSKRSRPRTVWVKFYQGLTKPPNLSIFWSLYSWFTGQRGPKSAEQQSENCPTWWFLSVTGLYLWLSRIERFSKATKIWRFPISQWIVNLVTWTFQSRGLNWPPRPFGGHTGLNSFCVGVGATFHSSH